MIYLGYNLLWFVLWNEINFIIFDCYEIVYDVWGFCWIVMICSVVIDCN